MSFVILPRFLLIYLFSILLISCGNKNKEISIDNLTALWYADSGIHTGTIYPDYQTFDLYVNFYSDGRVIYYLSLDGDKGDLNYGSYELKNNLLSVQGLTYEWSIERVVYLDNNKLTLGSGENKMVFEKISDEPELILHKTKIKSGSNSRH